ncbi:6-carboxytetrahydropterin synthase QueD [Desulfococcaceae bacterium HSG7]|nr:6-carboxytetrahydropterin synthase QueD [Desulfococcaceae bacterium HSG7]
MFELKVKTHFAAAHQLKMVGEKCENLHGHNWKIEICISGEKLNKAGVLVDFGIIKQHLSTVMLTLDHKFLNELEFFAQDNPPSSENIAVYIANKLQALIDDQDIRVSSVTAYESENAAATYMPPT